MDREAFLSDNQRYINWFDTVFKVEFLKNFPIIKDHQIILTKLDFFGALFFEYNIEFAVILEKITEDDLNPFRNFLSQFGTLCTLKTPPNCQYLILYNINFPEEMLPPKGVHLYSLEMWLYTTENQHTIVKCLDKQLSTDSEKRDFLKYENMRNDK